MNEEIDLVQLATQTMIERGFEPEFTRAEMDELAHINDPARPSAHHKDLRSLPWCSIDNDDSKDLDQITYAEPGEEHEIHLYVAIADVDSLVHKKSAVDLHARKNTTSVYTPAKIFSMLPEKLSTNLTSLNEHGDRLAIVTKITFTRSGKIEDSSLFQAVVHNKAQLTYNGVGNWLEGKTPMPEKISKTPGLEAAIKLQTELAQVLKKRRHTLGSLTLETAKPEAKAKVGQEILLELSPHNLAHQLIEEFMIAANFVMAKLLRKSNIPSLRRVVQRPKRWSRIVEIAASLGEELPSDPDSKALDRFLVKRKLADPDGFPDLSLAVIKLIGRGEYVVENPSEPPLGHFCLALANYTHSTAPNRRYPDLITQRQYKAYTNEKNSPYSLKELEELAAHCTAQEDAATKIERHMTKCAAAMLLSSRIGETFHGIITGRNEYGTWVRIVDPPVEGKLVNGSLTMDVGDKVQVRLEAVDIPRGFIDFSYEDRQTN